MGRRRHWCEVVAGGGGVGTWPRAGPAHLAHAYLAPSHPDPVISPLSRGAGNEKFTLRVRDIATKSDVLAKPIPDTAGNYVFSADATVLFYTTKDSLDRPYKVWRHVIGTNPASDACVYTEDDEAFYVGIGRSRSDALLLITAESALTTEVRCLDAGQPLGEFRVLFPRTHDVNYEAGHRPCEGVEGRGSGQIVYSVRDAARPNSELLVGSAADPLSSPTVLVPHRPDVKIEDFVVAASYLAVFTREAGLQTGTVYRLTPNKPVAGPLKKGARVQFDDPSYELGAGPQGDFESPARGGGMRDGVGEETRGVGGRWGARCLGARCLSRKRAGTLPRARTNDASNARAPSSPDHRRTARNRRWPARPRRPSPHPAQTPVPPRSCACCTRP